MWQSNNMQGWDYCTTNLHYIIHTVKKEKKYNYIRHLQLIKTFELGVEVLSLRDLV